MLPFIFTENAKADVVKHALYYEENRMDLVSVLWKKLIWPQKKYLCYR